MSRDNLAGIGRLIFISTFVFVGEWVMSGALFLKTKKKN